MRAFPFFAAGLSVVLTLTGIAPAQTKPKDVDGWGKIKWGMTVRQAKAVPGPEARESDGKSERNSDRYVERLTLNNIQVGGLQMAVGVYALPGSEKIMEVWLTSEHGTNKAGFFEDLRNSLTQKYGSPTREGPNDKNETLTSNSVTWVFPSTVISLMWMRINIIDAEVINLQYSATDKKTLDKL